MIYIIPYKERSTQIGKINNYTTLVNIQDRGIIVEHDKDQELDHAFILRHLIGLTDQYNVNVEADSPEQAIEILHKEWYGFSGAEKPACIISDREPIIEYPNCRFMVNMTGGYTGCAKWEDGEVLSPDKDSHCNCILHNHSEAPKDCPIANDKRIMDAVPVIKVINGYRFKRSGIRKNFGVKSRGVSDAKTDRIIYDLCRKNFSAGIAKNPSDFDMLKFKNMSHEFIKAYEKITKK